MRGENKYFFIIHWHMCRVFVLLQFRFLINKVTIVLRFVLWLAASANESFRIAQLSGIFQH